MKKNILVLPGTQWQVGLIKKIKEMGHNAFVINPAADSPAFFYADDHLQSDIFDKEKVIQYGKEHHIDAVMSDECDIAMNLVAELGSAFSVPTLDNATAALYTDKFTMREFCKEHGLNYPEYRFCETITDAITLLRKLQKPIIIKPLDSNASHGVFICRTEHDILQHFGETLKFSRSKNAVLAERYINGTEFTIDSIKTPSAHYALAISEKKHFLHNANIANELLFSHSNPQFDYEELRRVNNQFVNQTNLKFGFTHAEYKFENGKFYLIEIAARGGGNMISSVITQYLSGYDTYRYLIECATGNIHNEDFRIRSEYKDRVAVLKFFTTPNGGGRVKEIQGIDYLKSQADIAAYRFNFGVGEVIQDALNDSARIGFYIATCASRERLNIVMNDVANYVKIILE